MEKAPKKFKQVGDGEWQQPKMKNYFLRCCDCDLIHRVNFRVVVDRKGVARVQWQAFRVKS